MRRTLLTVVTLFALLFPTLAAADTMPDPEQALTDPGIEALAGFKLSQMFEKEYDGAHTILPATDSRVIYIRRITDRLSRVMRLDRPDMQFELKVIKSDEVNALCIPGGHIYVFTGLVDWVKSTFPANQQEDALAFVIGHEMAHAVLRHILQTWARSKEFKRELDDPAAFNKLMLSMSRTMEFEADRYGVLYALRAGFHPQVALELLDKLPSSKSLDSDHPTGGQRVRQIRTYLAQLDSLVDLWNEGVRAAHAQDFEQARTCFGVLKSEFPELPSVHNNLGWALLGLYQQSLPADSRTPQQLTYNWMPALGLTMRGVDKGDPQLLANAREEFSAALRLNPNLVAGYEGAAACAVEAKDLRLAGEMLKKASHLNTRDAALINLEGIVYERGGNVSAALASYNQASQLDGHYLPALYNLACVYQQQGKKSQAQQLLERYVEVDRNGFWADMARQHLQKLGARLPDVARGPAVPRVNEAGGVSLGATSEEVKNKLGNPDDTHALESGTEVYHYGRGVDVYLSSSGVTGVTVTTADVAPIDGVKVGMAAPDLEKTLGAPPSTGTSDGEDAWNYPSLGLIIGVRDGKVSSIAVQR